MWTLRMVRCLVSYAFLERLAGQVGVASAVVSRMPVLSLCVQVYESGLFLIFLWQVSRPVMPPCAPCDSRHAT